MSKRKVSVFFREAKNQENEELSAMEKKILQWAYAITKQADESETKSFHEAVISGELLCQIVNVIQPNIVKKIHTKGKTMLWVDNVQYFLNAAKQLGVASTDLFSSKDIEERRNRKLIVSCLVAVGQIANNKGITPSLDLTPPSLGKKTAAKPAETLAVPTTSEPTPVQAEPATSAPPATRSVELPVEPVLKHKRKQKNAGVQKHFKEERVSEDLVWSIIKGRSSFAAGRANNGRRFSREPFNPMNINCRRYSGLANTNAIDVSLSYRKNPVAYQGTTCVVKQRKSLVDAPKNSTVARSGTFNRTKTLRTIVTLANVCRQLKHANAARFYRLAAAAPKHKTAKKIKKAT